MKSLEIVNVRIAFIEASEWIKEESPYYYEKVVLEQLKELQQIKQDLDVLEIIRKKDVNIKLLKSYIKEELEKDEDILECYNSHLETYRQLTLEELLKLKKWLEMNVNENV